MEVTALYLYPVKGTRPVSVAESVVTREGLAGDRRYVFVDDSGNFLAQHVERRLGAFAVTPGPLTWVIEHPGALDRIDLDPESPRGTESVVIWRETVPATHVSSTIDAYFSDALRRTVRVVEIARGTRHRVDPDVWVGAADKFPLLVTNERSLDDLNARVPGEPVEMLAFRPNVVVRAPAWAEDEWMRVSIGATSLELTERCNRCVVTTLNPSVPTHARGDGEPLRTLATFRRDEHGRVMFGRYAQCLVPGAVLRVGDSVTALGD